MNARAIVLISDASDHSIYSCFPICQVFFPMSLSFYLYVCPDGSHKLHVRVCRESCACMYVSPCMYVSAFVSVHPCVHVSINEYVRACSLFQNVKD